MSRFFARYNNYICQGIVKNDLKEIYSLLDLNFDAKLEASFNLTFRYQLERIRNAVSAKENILQTESVKESFVEWTHEQLDKAIVFAENFIKEKDEINKVKNLGYCFGIMMGVIEYTIQSKMIVQWEFSGDFQDAVEKITLKFDAIVVTLQKANKNIMLKHISSRANKLSRRLKKAQNYGYHFAHNSLIQIASSLQTDHLG